MSIKVVRLVSNWFILLYKKKKKNNKKKPSKNLSFSEKELTVSCF